MGGKKCTSLNIHSNVSIHQFLASSSIHSPSNVPIHIAGKLLSGPSRLSLHHLLPDNHILEKARMQFLRACLCPMSHKIFEDYVEVHLHAVAIGRHTCRHGSRRHGTIGTSISRLYRRYAHHRCRTSCQHQLWLTWRPINSSPYKDLSFLLKLQDSQFSIKI